VTFAPSSAPIIVVGSANQDYIVGVPRPPAAGETVLAKTLLKQPGGKGANQAVAAARLRADVSFIASIGDDAEGAFLLRELRSEGVDTTNVEMISRGMTGLALISVHDNGENSITVVPGTNHFLTAERVEATVTRLIRDAGDAIVVIQGEVLPDIVRTTLRVAHEAGGRAVLNLAPYMPLPKDALAVCDPLVVNESEASALVGWEVRDAASARRAAEQILGLTPSVVVTIGAEGAYWADADSAGHVPAPIVPEVVDTAGAGDAFVGALAAVLAAGRPLAEAVAVGVQAGSFAVQSPGAQSSYPTLEDLRLDAATLRPAEIP
jgi:ribokinase